MVFMNSCRGWTEELTPNKSFERFSLSSSFSSNPGSYFLALWRCTHVSCFVYRHWKSFFNVNSRKKLLKFKSRLKKYFFCFEWTSWYRQSRERRLQCHHAPRDIMSVVGVNPAKRIDSETKKKKSQKSAKSLLYPTLGVWSHASRCLRYWLPHTRSPCRNLFWRVIEWKECLIDWV